MVSGPEGALSLRRSAHDQFAPANWLQKTKMEKEQIDDAKNIDIDAVTNRKIKKKFKEVLYHIYDSNNLRL